MDACCPKTISGPSPQFRRVLWIALVVNAAMFLVEVGAGIASGSASLQADALDFFGDAANYALTLAVLPLGLAWRARAAMAKGLSMGLFGVGVLGVAAFYVWSGEIPHPATMGVVGFAALAANLAVAGLLFRYRDGDANMRSVWLCTRNDAIGNVMVLIAALGVFGTGTVWPDVVVASAMAVLAISAAWQTLRAASGELAQARVPAGA